MEFRASVCGGERGVGWGGQVAVSLNSSMNPVNLHELNSSEFLSPSYGLA